MDKETLSNYGWIVICVLVLAVMLALATPFGTFVADAVKSTTQGLFDVNQNALNSTGLINIEGQEFESCAHDYEVTSSTVNCNTGGSTTHTCKICGKSYTETTPAGHKWDNTGLTCTECGVTVVEYKFKASDYDAKMGTTTATDSVVVIPETFEYNGTKYKVTEIEGKAFENCTDLKSITLPNSIERINYNAFCGCSSLENIELPQSITSIAHNVFKNCSSLKEITIPENVTNLAASLFYGCTSLESITIHQGVTRINNATFYKCTSLTSVIFENPSGWTLDTGTVLSADELADTYTAATYLKSTHYVRTWYRSE